jgi:ribosomal peptide maturation radical SAM protein 1
MFRVMLVNVPFANINRPSLGLSLLKAAMVRENVHCDVAYINLDYAKLIGRACYKQLSDFNTTALIGEWIFAAAAFDQDAQESVRYCAEVLHPLFNLSDEDDKESESGAWQRLIADLPIMRSQATAFLDSCLSRHDWGSYDLIGFTSTFQQNTPALGLARRLKSKYPHILIAFGGANCEDEMGIAIHRNFEFVDFVCSGEGDEAFPALVQALAARRDPPAIDGIIRRSDGCSLLPNKMTNPVRELDVLPSPDFGDFFAQYLASFGSLDDIVMPIESSRGCWWGQKAHCIFCGLNGSTMSFRSKSPAHFLDELVELAGRYGVRDFAATDNILDWTYFSSFLPELRQKDLDLNLMYETKSNLREDQVRLLSECGVRIIQPGIESLSTGILKLMRKGVHAYQNIRLLRWCAEYLIYPTWNLLAGFPSENPEEYSKQADIIPFIEHLAPPTGVTPVRLDRFSPLFTFGEKLGVHRIRPVRAYSHVYSLPIEELEALAYFFDFDYSNNQDPATYVPSLTRAVERWMSGTDFGKLIALDDGKSIAISDGRATARAPNYQLTGWQRVLYQVCNVGSTLSRIEDEIIASGYEETSAQAVRDCLAELIDARLLMYIDDRYLSLAIRGDYHFRLLAHHLSKGEEIREKSLRDAANRLFEFHTSRFADHLARHLDAAAT